MKKLGFARRFALAMTRVAVGYSNTLPAIIEALGAARPTPICDTKYDNLYVVTIAPGKRARLVRAEFGARTPVDSACAATMR